MDVKSLLGLILILCYSHLVQGFPSESKCAQICNRDDYDTFEPQLCKVQCKDWSSKTAALEVINGNKISEHQIKNLKFWIGILCASNAITFLLLLIVLLICMKRSKFVDSVKKFCSEKSSKRKLRAHGETTVSVIHVNQRASDRRVAREERKTRSTQVIEDNANKVQLKTQRSSSLSPITTIPPGCPIQSTPIKTRLPGESRSPAEQKSSSVYDNPELSLSTSTLMPGDSSGNEFNSTLFTGLSTATLDTTVSHGDEGNNSSSNNSNNNTSLSTPACSPVMNTSPRCVSTQL